MKFLHTSDWHLGQVFFDRTRTEEHQRFLNWLIDTLRDHQVSLFLHAGDIFDHPNPSHESLRLFFTFLHRMATETPVERSIWIAGNHDSAALLQAFAPILTALNATLVSTPEDENIFVESDDLLIAAVPFLRERDIVQSSAGLTVEERERRIIEAIEQFYQHIATLADRRKSPGQKVIAMGHLFVRAAKTAGSERIVHIGNLGSVPSTIFPDTFDYAALGHIHRYQRIAGATEIVYSGAPIPLSFDEVAIPHGVILGNWQNSNTVEIDFLPVPQFRLLKVLRGTVDQLLEAVETLPDNLELSPWISCLVEAPAVGIDVIETLRNAAADRNAEILQIQPVIDRPDKHIDRFPHLDLIAALQPETMFEKLCEERGIDAKQQKILRKYFHQALQRAQEQSAAAE